VVVEEVISPRLSRDFHSGSFLPSSPPALPLHRSSSTVLKSSPDPLPHSVNIYHLSLPTSLQPHPHPLTPSCTIQLLPLARSVHINRHISRIRLHTHTHPHIATMSNPIYAYREYLHLLPHLFFVRVEKQAPGEACIACDSALTRQLYECNTCTLRLCEPCRDQIVDRYHMGSLAKLMEGVASWKLRYRSPVGMENQQRPHQQHQQVRGGADMSHQTVIMMMQDEHGRQQLQHQHQLQIHHQGQQRELQRIQQQREQEDMEEERLMLQMDGGLRTRRKFLEMMQKIQSEIEIEAELENMDNMLSGMRGRGPMGGGS